MSYILKSFVYDPFQQGYDTNTWKTVAGAPAIVANGRFAVDSGAGQGAAIHFVDFVKGDIHFDVNIPVAPGVNSSRHFGVSVGVANDYIRFAISDNLTCQTKNGSNTSESDPILWDAAGWNGINVDFNIRWYSGVAKFFINGTQVYTVADESVPYGPLSLYIADESGSPMTFGIISVRGTQSYVENPVSADTGNFGQGQVVMSQLVTVSEGVTIKIPTLLLPNFGETLLENVVVSENVVLFIPEGSLPYDGGLFESVTVSEDISLLIPELLIPYTADTLYEDVTITEDISLLIPLLLVPFAAYSLYEDVTITEDISLLIPELVIPYTADALYEDVTITEDVVCSVIGP